MSDEDWTQQCAAHAARLVVEEGLEYASAKRKAARELGKRGGRSAETPSNELVEDEVRDYLQLFCADTQPAELRALRDLALRWMQRLAEFRPHVGGAVWRGTATRLSNIILDLYADDPKSVEIAFLNLGLDFDSGGASADDPLVLSLSSPCRPLGETVTVHCVVQDYDALRGALKPDSRGHSWRGDAKALQKLLDDTEDTRP